MDNKEKKQNEEADLTWELVKSEHIIQDEWIDFRRQAYRLPDGKVWEPYYNYSRRNYVVIVARDEEGRYICVRQFRHGIGRVTTEFCAGGIEVNGAEGYDSMGESEDALDAAKRELQEETGYVSDDWHFLMGVPSNATIADNYGYMYVADHCRRVSGQDLDEMEFLNVSLLSEEEVRSAIKDGSFAQAIHILAWMLSRGSI